MKYFFTGYLLILGVCTSAFSQDNGMAKSIERGSEIYADFCITCHLDKGQGVEAVFPPLAKSDYLMENRKESLFGIKYGRSGEITVNGVVYNNTMVAFGLEDQEIADVMNFITNSWGNKNDKMVTEEEVAAITK